MIQHRYTNSLIHETSPYLLQHAHNPVNWMPWGEAALQKAREENKLLLISIGYAACHWCHVMEKESFEDELVANVMNKDFICIKIDREERPDIDQVYMTAVQLITQSGGWPLNVIALPDGRPIWGGTYFPEKQWVETLQQIEAYHRYAPNKTEEYAARLQQGIEQSLLIAPENKQTSVTTGKIASAIEKWKSVFDQREGGRKGAPKFMMPGIVQFLMRWAHRHDPKLSGFVQTTLSKMALGGIYDHAGGGFARYSTDSHWKVPHFEKMLYDNGQLMSLYAQAWQKFHDPLYKQVAEQTVDWLKREMRSPESGFYSSLDADSEGGEGSFYIWKKPELESLFKEEFPLIEAYYNVNAHGHWEEGTYILLRKMSDDAFAEKYNLTKEELAGKVSHWNAVLLRERSKRARPATDKKILASWNALTIIGLTDACKAFGNPEHLLLAEQNAGFVLDNMLDQAGLLHHSWKDGILKPESFLEDHAFFIQALTGLFGLTGKEAYLRQAESLTEATFQFFFEPSSGMFYFSPSTQDNLISRNMEVYDNVIPSSNSVMANNLYRLGHLLGRQDYLRVAHAMLETMGENALEYPSGHANWLNLAMNLSDEQCEVVITGPEAARFSEVLQACYLPDCLFCFGNNESLPLLKQRVVKDQTLIYVCRDQACLLPVKTTEEALMLLAVNHEA